MMGAESLRRVAIRVADLAASAPIAVRAVLLALATVALLHSLRSPPTPDPAPLITSSIRPASIRPADPAVTFESFPGWYFSADAFWPGAPLSRGAKAAPSTADTAPASGMRLASVTTTPVLDPPEARTSESRRSSMGIASFYRHHTRTASGERYDERELTAAHRTLPFGTRLKVTSVATGRSVTVRVNDRGPYVPGRIVDLSYSAAERIGMVDRGVTKVKVEVVQ